MTRARLPLACALPCPSPSLGPGVPPSPHSAPSAVRRPPAPRPPFLGHSPSPLWSDLAPFRSALCLRTTVWSSPAARWVGVSNVPRTPLNHATPLTESSFGRLPRRQQGRARWHHRSVIRLRSSVLRRMMNGHPGCFELPSGARVPRWPSSRPEMLTVRWGRRAGRTCSTRHGEGPGASEKQRARNRERWRPVTADPSGPRASRSEAWAGAEA